MAEHCMFPDRGNKREAEGAPAGASAAKGRPTGAAEARKVPEDNDLEIIPFNTLMCKFMLAQGLSN